MIKFTNKKVIDCFDWDKLVKETYCRPYCFQQQEGCQSRGNVNITIPSEETYDDEMHDSIPEVINGEIMGVKFQTWLSRDPKAPLASGREDSFGLELFWQRNFYPDIQVVANDLYEKGLIEAGDYVINIDW